MLFICLYTPNILKSVFQAYPFPIIDIQYDRIPQHLIHN